MENLISIIINDLKSIDIYKLKRIKEEKEFEDYVVKRLKKLNRDLNIKTQDKSYREGRQIRPDITIGRNEILIELKFNLKNLEDIYRLYYQAIKYSKLAKKQLIMCVHDPKEFLLKSDIKDLESIDKVIVVHIY
ncbi:MAG: hypothetical protein ACTSO2_19425 [Promethearchaeota archaeon]